ncbi:MAG: type II secretion system F family protein [Lachnospiraceae bacterium]|nr:type II secretion system F family protein [Lachnospiraceae bacterium]
MGKKAGVQETTEVRNGTDYNEYKMNPVEWVLYAVAAGAILFCVGYIFYQNVILSSLLALGGLFYPKMRRKQIIKSRKNKLNLQFKDMLYSLSSAVGAGNSVEKALSVTLEDMRQQYNDPNAFIIKELELMVSRVSLNNTIEDVLNDFAERSHLENIQTFANIFEISKRTGGNLIQIIRNTTQIIADKIETQTEIETMIAGQQMEQKVLIVMPMALVFFMTKAGGGFMDPIFNTGLGRIIATISLAVILLGAIWSKKIADIKI